MRSILLKIISFIFQFRGGAAYAITERDWRAWQVEQLDLLLELVVVIAIIISSTVVPLSLNCQAKPSSTLTSIITTCPLIPMLPKLATLSLMTLSRQSYAARHFQLTSRHSLHFQLINELSFSRQACQNCNEIEEYTVESE